MSDLILLVDDERDLVSALGFAFHREGFRTRAAHDGATALRESRRSPRPDLILLDLMLPDLPGTEVCRQLKADPTTAGIPIIMLTARSDELDRVVGFEVGADDYVPKPFSTRELVLRIRAVLRRSRPRDGHGQSVEIGCLRVDFDGHQVWVGEQEQALTAIEFRLLSFLLRPRGRVQSRDTLLQAVWGDGAGVTTRTVDTHVKRLRQKLGPAGSYVQTVRGVGYKFLAGAPSDPPSV